ncbi:hypothetical protein ALC53_06326 [Atta colombica]|uniref:Uncharacterized protein n=1 Tax=Atta colombica TaxID=520822 RepID=A0A195BEP3_9HYME|nr:hypothetical protein ALC53_06326 [Atta colombica]
MGIKYDSVCRKVRKGNVLENTPVILASREIRFDRTHSTKRTVGLIPKFHAVDVTYLASTISTLGSGQGERVSKFYREEVRENCARNERNGSIDL